MARLRREQRVQRVDPDRRGAERPGTTAQHIEFAEVTDAPITAAAQPVNLRRQTPAARPRQQPFREVARSRRNDQVDLGFTTSGLSRRERQPMIAERQSAREMQRTRLAAAAPFAAVFKPYMPLHAALRGPR